MVKTAFENFPYFSLIRYKQGCLHFVKFLPTDNYIPQKVAICYQNQIFGISFNFKGLDTVAKPILEKCLEIGQFDHFSKMGFATEWDGL